MDTIISLQDVANIVTFIAPGYFANLAWFNEKTDKWDEREGGIIVERSEIEYIQTPKLLNK